MRGVAAGAVGRRGGVWALRVTRVRAGVAADGVGRRTAGDAGRGGPIKYLIKGRGDRSPSAEGGAWRGGGYLALCVAGGSGPVLRIGECAVVMAASGL